MIQNNTTLQEMLSHFDFEKPLHQNLANLQKILQRQSISATSRFGLQAYEMICQEYINLAQGKGSQLIVKTEHTERAQKQISMSPKVGTVLFTDKEKALLRVIKHRHFQDFLKFAKLDDIAIKKEDQRIKRLLKMETAKFHFRIKYTRKCMDVLKENHRLDEEFQKKANDFRQSKREIMLEEYFLAWKDEFFMTAAEKEFRKSIDDRYVVLAKILFLRRLISSKNLNSKPIDHRQLKEELNSKLMMMKVSLFFQNLKKNEDNNIQFRNKVKSLQLIQKQFYIQSFLKANNKFKIFRSLSQNQREKFITKTLYSKLLLKRMKASLQLRRVYFKRKEKIIFLSLLLEGINESFKRKGYQYSWMNTLTQNLEFVDSKLDFKYRRFRLSKIFKELRKQLRQQSEKMEEVKHFRSKQIVKQLIYNYKLSIFKQKEQHKVEAVEFIQRRNMISKTINSFKLCRKEEKREETLRNFIIQGKLKKGMNYLKIYYRSSRYYGNKLTYFLEQRQIKQLNTVFQSFKSVLITERVNNRIVEEYQNYINQQKLQQIFQCFKDYTFTEQLIRKRERNVMRIRIRQYADQLFYNLKIQLYSQMKKRYNSIKESLVQIQRLRYSNAFIFIYRRFNSSKQRVLIEKQIVKEYQLRFQWKMFNLLKVISQRSLNEEKIVKQIQHKLEKKTKERVIDVLVTKFLFSLLMKKVGTNLKKKLMINGFLALKQAEYSIKEESQEGENDSQLNDNQNNCQQI